jgi:hypothetical protein
MGRKPNYKFERLERERKKANKKAAKLEAKRDAKGDADETAPATRAVNADRDGPTDD